MKCYNCEHILPDDSEFCQYCGKKIINELPLQDNTDEKNIVEPIGINENVEVNSTNVKKATVQVIPSTIVKNPLVEIIDDSQENNTKKKYRTKFCKLCGGQIDDHTKRCSGCGKQYFKGIKFNKFFVTVLTLSLVIITSIILNIIQFVEMNEINADVEYYKQKTEEKQMKISELYKKIIEKENHLNYYEKYAAIVPDDGSKKYHIHGCKDLDSSTSFWIYNYNAAEERGYSACSICYPKKVLLDELNKKYGVGQ